MEMLKFWSNLIYKNRCPLDFIFWPINRLIYRKPYSKWYDLAYDFFREYKVPKFFELLEDDGISNVEIIKY